MLKQLKLISLYLSLLIFAFSLAACGGGGGGGGGGAPETTTNNAPISNAGSDQVVSAGAIIFLSGAESNDSDNDPLTYSWSISAKPTNSSTTLSNSTSMNTEFIIDVEGIYTIQLIVNDGSINSTANTVVVTANNTVSNTPPRVNAGLDQFVKTGQTVNLDGSGSSDDDGDMLVYKWSITNKPGGSNVILANNSTVSPSFIVDVEGTYEIQLIVNDGSVDSAPDIITVVVTDVATNTPPVANAGPDVSVDVGTVVNLDGGASSDANNDVLSYQWSLTKPAGSAASLSSPTTAVTTLMVDVEGVYESQLVVNDGGIDSAPDVIVITVTQKASNSAPIANAGLDKTVATGGTVNLNGSGSSDPDGDALTYTWTFLSAPQGSNALMYNFNTATPYFVPDLDGSYTFELVVNDGTVDSATDTIVVTSVSVAPPVNTYQIDVSREDSNLYEVIGEDIFIMTSFCYEFVFFENALLHGTESIDFLGQGTSCNVNDVYGRVTSTVAGNYSVTTSRESGDWYKIHETGEYLQTSFCFQYVFFDNAVFSLNSFGSGTLYFGNGSSCPVTGYYAPLNL